jgi:regulator of protease activity HflC (stomatin/prohibitin superfamily)
MESNIFGKIVGAVAAFIFITVVWSSYYTIDQGERGVILHNGAMSGESEPGLHFKTPLITTIEKIPVTQQNLSWNKDSSGDSRMQVYTQDQQPTTVAISILFHVTDVSQVYAHYTNISGLEERLIEPKVPEQVKNVFGQFTAISAIQDRAKLDQEVANAVKGAIQGPLVVDSVQVQDIDFSQAYEQAVEARMQAIVAQQQAEAEKARRITNANAAAYEVTASADAKAHQITVQGNAEAGAIKARADALKENSEMPSLVAAEKWDGHLPTTMPPNGTLPFLSLNH